MTAADIAQLCLSATIFIIFVGFLVWGIRTGQFRGVEEAKYQVFKDDDDMGESDAGEGGVGDE